MLKRILTLCAAVALTASAVLAGNAAGTYTTDTADGKLVIEFRPLQDDLLNGTVHLGDQEFPIIAKQFGDNLNGTWEAQNKHIPFTSSLADGKLTLTTNGATYTLTKSATAGSAPVALGESQPPAAETETREGRAFRYVVPKGWAARESESGVDMGDRGSITSVSMVLLFSPGQSTPENVFQFILNNAETLNWSDVKVESTTPRNQGTKQAQGMTYSLSYKFKGTPVRGEVVVIVYNEEKRNIARIVTLQGPADSFAAGEKTLMDLAHKIVVTHAELIDPDAAPKAPVAQPEKPQVYRDEAEPLPILRQANEAREKRQADAAEQFDAMIRGQK